MKIQHAVPGAVSKPRAAALAVVALVAAAIVSSAAATSGTPVSISNTVTSFEPGAVSDFTSTGGVVCASGTSTALSAEQTVFAGSQSGFKAQLLVRRTFVCDDGSGSFDLLLRVTLDFGSGDTSGTWSVVDGTGGYEKLHGGGTISGDRLPGGGIQDEYEGTAHVD